MGTRADFYIGKGLAAEWIGSTAWDGYRDGIDEPILLAKTPDEFRAAVDVFLFSRDDATRPDQGWPWPWNDSATSDCSYWHFDGRTWDDHGGSYAPCDAPEPESTDGLERIEFPDMSARKNVTLGRRSGVIVFGSR